MDPQNSLDEVLPIHALLTPAPQLTVEPLLGLMSDQAEQADQTRLLSAELVQALRQSDIMRLTATAEIGGLGASMQQVGRELEAIASCCASTAWIMWNHLAVFHLFAGTLGPAHSDVLTAMVRNHEWVCFPAGAGSTVAGVIDGNQVRINGRGAFATGSRYADWAGVVFAVTAADGTRAEPLDLRFTIVRLDSDGVKIDPTWDGNSLRASATDDVHYTDAVVDLSSCVPWFGANRAEALREVPVVSHRYREDWVGLSDIWLGWMAVGVVRAALADATEQLRTRRSILGKKMVTRPTVQVNLGTCTALLSAAEATMLTACREVDDRITSGTVPTPADYLRQMALSTAALNQLDQAMSLLQRSQGGNGLRESGSFNRRWRDFQSMPLHINAHQDRVHHQLGRFVLGEDLEPF